VFGADLDRTGSIFGLTDDGQIRLGFQECANALANQHMVIGNDESDGIGIH
jgi:hypothetical protein